MPTGIMSTLSAFLFSWLASKWENRRCLVTILAAILPIVGSVIVYTLPRSNIGGQMVGIYLLYTYFGPYVVGKFPRHNVISFICLFRLTVILYKVSQWVRRILLVTRRRISNMLSSILDMLLVCLVVRSVI